MTKKSTKSTAKAPAGDIKAETKMRSFASLTKAELITELENAHRQTSYFKGEVDSLAFINNASDALIKEIIKIVEKHLNDLELPRKFTWLWIVTNISTVAKLLKEIFEFLKSIKKYKNIK